ncbi:mannose-6-phosphate isomerase, class I [Xylanimonas allomyrinae]|uniref:mannose-6-phosphate isomerase n=1 Tax=Xylanimonas allomyrinae TaxID=2509459 RepID=A0A4P6EL46_9MICO|nr:mannose-6-phosphate isomerase, class I [Xylanimonas allomyrinae]QAY63354.1 mannose-6-phosphate isomerase, class I [Xylanimonas allomyrinae]
MSRVVPPRPLRLTNTVQRYDWGSVDAIPALLGVAADGGPMAELWLGGHPSAPSFADVDGASVDLPTLIREAPSAMLGRRIADEFGPRLPYLLKVLAASRALSLQVHPKPHAAREGFNHENALGLPVGSPKRSFHDDQHKPEMVVALSQFEGLAGFRSPRTILAILEGLDGRLVEAVRARLRADRSDASMRQAFQVLLGARSEATCRDDIDVTVAAVGERLASGSPFARADSTVVELAQQHPGDPGAIASLMLNRVTLEPGESMFTPAGEVHAYLSGLGIEVMASSDNVLRAGLTTKLVDEEALVRCASFAPRMPVLPQVHTSGSRGQVQTYRAPVREFALTTADVDPSEEVALPVEGPRVVLCLDGQIDLRTASGTVSARHGQSVFVPHAAGPVAVAGTGHLVCSWVP